ncbi:MAG: DUF1614 domain-containing protein [Sulfolobus sp.]|nr:DUF1614 domain-containing protein [Sulfolobus sp.]
MSASKKRVVYTRIITEPFMLIMYIISSLIVLIVTLNYLEIIFSYLNLSKSLAIIFAIGISILSLLFSPVNIIIKRKERKKLIEIGEDRIVYVFGIPIYFPSLRIEEKFFTYIAINVGGALIPLLLSFILIYFCFISTFYNIIKLLIDVFFISLISKIFSKVVPTAGVAMNPLIPPLFSIIFTYLLFSDNIFLIPLASYISSVSGTILGADILNLKKVMEEGAILISIGGMGTFDGIYISAIFSLLLSFLLIPLPKT